MVIGSTPRKIFIIATLLMLHASAFAKPIDQKFPDFTLPSTNMDYAYRLYEQRGKPIMLIDLQRCDQCQKKLLEFENLASSYAEDGLVVWLIWTPYKKNQPPHLQFPVLNSFTNYNSGWEVPSQTASLLFIDREGLLSYQVSGSVRTLIGEAKKFLPEWLQKNQLQFREK